MLSPQLASAQQKSSRTVETRATASEDARFASGFVTRTKLQDLSAHEDGLAGALEQVPGLSIRRQSSYGQPAYVQIRGGNPRQLVVLLNGVRIRVPSGVGFDVGGLATTGIDAVKVYRGPAAVIHGGGALTGAIELQIAPRIKEGYELSSSLLGGSFSTQELSSRADFAMKARGSGRLAVNLRRAKGGFIFTDPQGSGELTRQNNDHSHLQAIGSGSWRGPRGHVGISLLAERGESGVAGPSEFQNLFGAARLTEQRVVAASDGLKRDVLKGKGWTIDMGRVFGLQWRGQNYDNTQAVLGQGLFANTSSATTTEAGINFLLATQSKTFATLSASSRTEFFFSSTRQDMARPDVLNTRRKTLHLALGGEKILLEDRLHLTATGRLEIVKNPDQRWLPMMGGVGAIYQPLKKLDLRLIGNLARTYRVPDFDELYLDTEFVRGDTSLSPERGVMSDLGVRVTPARLAEIAPTQLELVAFSNLTQDQIAFVPVSAYLVSARNFERVRARGIEAAVTTRPLERLEFASNYTLTDTWRPQLATRTPLPGQPRHRIDGRTTLDLSRVAVWRSLHTVELHSRISWRSSVALDSFASQTNPGWTRWDAGLTVAPTTWLTCQGNATNLLNHRRAVDSLQRPLPGRAFYVSVTLTTRSTP